MRNSKHDLLKIRIDLSKNRRLSFLCFLLILVYSSALKASGALSYSFIEAFLSYVVVPIILGLLVIESAKTWRLTNNKLVITLVVLAYFAINVFYIYTKPSFARILVTAIFLLFLYQNEETQAHAFRMMKKALAISCVLGIVLGLLLLADIHGPIRIDPIDNKRTFATYLIVYFCKGRGIWRYCGFYNEPGALGTFCALFLCADSLNLKKKENIAILIGGFMSFSLAFIVIIGLFYAMKSATNWRRWLILLIIVVAYLFVIPNIHTGNIGIDTVLNRLSFDGDSLAGDNRTNTRIEYLYNETLHSQYALFGRKLGFANVTSGFSSNLVGPSYKTYIIDLGIIGTVLLLAPLCITEVKRSKNNRDAIIYVIITLVNFYQRAMLLHRFIYFAVFIGGVSYLLQKQDSESLTASESLGH